MWRNTPHFHFTELHFTVSSFVPFGVFTRSSKRPAIHVYFEYICWKFAGRLLDRVNTLLLICQLRATDLLGGEACSRLLLLLVLKVSVTLQSTNSTGSQHHILIRFCWLTIGSGAIGQQIDQKLKGFVERFWIITFLWERNLGTKWAITRHMYEISNKGFWEWNK